MPPPQARARVRVCYATLLPVDELMRCARCKGARYATRALQKAHWPIHKLVCRPCNPAVGEGKSFEEVYRLVTEGLNRGGDADLAALLKRLMHLWTHQEDDEGMDTAEMQLHALARGVIFVEGELYSQKLWACPGMPEFLLDVAAAARCVQRRVITRAYVQHALVDDALDLQGLVLLRVGKQRFEGGSTGSRRSGGHRIYSSMSEK